MIRTPYREKPKGVLILRKSFASWSAGTPITFIEYCDYKGRKPTGVLGRIRNEMHVVPIDLIVERRVRSS